ncbi:MAG: MYXO-CTERM sorting domain-containing protein [Byssovorax sp.]
MKKTIAAAAVFFSLIGTAEAGTITAQGNVLALNNVNQLKGVIGTAAYDEGPLSGNVPLGQYTGQGMTFYTGAFNTILPGVAQAGTATAPGYWNNTAFPAPIAGGGVHNGAAMYLGGVVKFAPQNITQFGMTCSPNGTQYITIWNKQGGMIGQVTWAPAGDAAFVGIDSKGVPIGMLSFGNDDVWAGQAYDVGGSTNISDTWIWATGACTQNAQCDDGNACTTDTCNLATGACSNVNNALPCNDGNACTQTDTCQNGQCVGGNLIACQPIDNCHVAGVCNPGTGQCSNPPKQDGSACNDNNPCTQNDACSAGVCNGAAISCQPLDGCHSAGVCNPASGQCSNPPKPDGSACNDNNGCTQTDTCQAGVCVGGMPVICPAPDACHLPGSCNAATGMCSNPNKGDGTPCDDANACTQGDTCQNGVCMGGPGVTCPAPDGCHDAPMCDPMTGVCNNPVKADGTPCDDGNPCSQTDTCQNGICVGGNPKTCAAMDSCHTAGLCNPATGDCSNPSKADGTACDDGDACTQIDSCQAGTCKGSSPVSCKAKDECHDVGVCDPMSGLCNDPFKAEGTPCDDKNECTEQDACAMGTCGGKAKPDGTPCSIGTCQAGTCTMGGTTTGSGGGGGGTTTGRGGSGGSGGSTTSTTGAGGSGTTSSGGDTGGSSGGCGCGVASSREGGAAWLALGLILAARRRRRAS